MLSALLLGVGAAVAGPVDDGDRAWAAGDRRAARAAWAQAEVGADPAAAAMAAVRLLLVDGTTGLFTHGPRADAALARCPTADPACALATADYLLFTRHIGIPTEPRSLAAAVRAARAADPDRGACRAAWAAFDPALLPPADADGLCAALRLGGGRFPAGPGTWSLGLGPLGAPGLGVGGSLRFAHPDLALRGHRLDLGLTAATRGFVAVQAGFEGAGRWSAGGDIALSRVPVDVYDGARRVSTGLARNAALAAGPRWDPGPVRLGLQPVLRWDAAAPGAAPLRGHGLGAQLRFTAGRLRGGLAAEGTTLDYRHLALDADLRRAWSLGRPVLAARALAAATPGSTAPLWRRPSAGGGVALRSGPLGRFRADTLAAAALELRTDPSRLAGAVVFAEAAAIDGLHGGAGLGLRLRLPPRPANTFRFDVAYGDGGLGISAGVGEAF